MALRFPFRQVETANFLGLSFPNSLGTSHLDRETNDWLGQVPWGSIVEQDIKH